MFSNVDQSLVGLEQHARLDQDGVSGSAVRQLSILAHREIGGIRFPTEWSERFATIENRVSIFEVIVNPALNFKDFDEPNTVPDVPGEAKMSRIARR